MRLSCFSMGLRRYQELFTTNNYEFFAFSDVGEKQLIANSLQALQYVGSQSYPEFTE